MFVKFSAPAAHLVTVKFHPYLTNCGYDLVFRSSHRLLGVDVQQQHYAWRRLVQESFTLGSVQTVCRQ